MVRFAKVALETPPSLQRSHHGFKNALALQEVQLNRSTSQALLAGAIAVEDLAET